jgi:ligand-binding SRPBCC domain-containing protein
VPTFEAAAEFACPPAKLFDFLARPANLPKVSPPELHLRLEEAPEQIAVGSRLTIEARHLGIRQRLTTVVVALEPDRLIVDEQVEGPFRKYRHERRLKEIPGGVVLTEHIEYEPPGGMIGLLVTKSRIEKYIVEMHDYRTRAMQALLNPATDR